MNSTSTPVPPPRRRSNSRPDTPASFKAFRCLLSAPSLKGNAPISDFLYVSDPFDQRDRESWPEPQWPQCGQLCRQLLSRERGELMRWGEVNGRAESVEGGLYERFLQTPRRAGGDQESYCFHLPTIDNRRTTRQENDDVNSSEKFRSRWWRKG